MEGRSRRTLARSSFFVRSVLSCASMTPAILSTIVSLAPSQYRTLSPLLLLRETLIPALMKSVLNAAEIGIDVETVAWPTNDAGRAFPKPTGEKQRPKFGVQINRNLDPAARYITLVHELAHVLCGHCGPTRKDGRDNRTVLEKKVKEFEAESVAYLVAARQRLETDHPRYLADYVGADGLIPEIDIATVFSVANTAEELGRKTPPKPQKPTAGSENGEGQV